jgi:predicted 3-demethylubiquinone-9 3-methyltransferase (glyoxalase superfamily)
MVNSNLTIETITFGKYKGQILDKMLKDRTYCNWLLKEDWFEKNYEYLYRRVLEYNPRTFFIKKIELENDGTNYFLNNYTYFNLNSLEELKINLTENEKVCYKFYLDTISNLKQKILDRISCDKENCFDIKAPVKWLQKFETETGLKREEFKVFINSYDLPNIPYIIEDIKKQGGIQYKGAKSFIIAKENSGKQEKYWENLLKNKYGEDIGMQFKYQKCIFDFINIDLNTIYECKINLKDYNEHQHKKYLLALSKYKILYLISNDCVINIDEKKIYTTNPTYYIVYLCNIPLLTKPTNLDELILDFSVIEVDTIENIL